jgi:hypothetical protein
MAIEENEALVNVTWAGQNGDLRDPVAYDATDGDVRQWVTEAVRGGGIPGIDADPNANFTDYIVQRFPAKGDGDEAKPNRIMVRPKTPFGV